MVSQWNASATACKTSSKLFDPFDIKTFDDLSEKYKSLSAEDKGKYKSMDDYVVQHDGPELSNLNRSYIKLVNEVNSRLMSTRLPERLPIDLLIQKDAVLDLLASLENENYIKEVYKTKKHKVKDGLNTTEAICLMDCIKQGRSLFHAGACADTIAKPLIEFYAACAYAYAIIVINSPLHKSIRTLKGSHGHTYNHSSGAIEFGGDIPSGTFLDLLCALSTAQIRNDSINIKYSLLPSIDMIQRNSISISLMALLSMVPELNGYYTQVDTSHHLVHKLSVDAGIVNSKATYNFYIGDGINKPDKEKLEKAFHVTNISENQGSYQFSVPSEEISTIMPCVYHDLRGQLWYIESPIEGMVLPELCLHFLIISALCNIMRYSPPEWSKILSNKISSQFSLLISKYLRLFELKYPILVSELVTNFSPIITDK